MSGGRRSGGKHADKSVVSSPTGAEALLFHHGTVSAGFSLDASSIASPAQWVRDPLSWTGT